MRATHSKKVGIGSNKRPEKLNVHIRNSWRTNLQLIRLIGNMIRYKKTSLIVAVSLRSQDGKRITNSPNAAAKNSGAISERSFSEKNCKEFEVIIIYSA